MSNIFVSHFQFQVKGKRGLKKKNLMDGLNEKCKASIKSEIHLFIQHT
jgi:hypothetical protein